jgi:hypothetical protein
MSFSLANIDRRVFYWILFVALMVPFLNPIGFPIKIAPNTRDLYEGITGDSVEPGDVWILNFGYGVSAWPECHPGVTVCAKALLREGAKVILMGPHTDVELTYYRLLDTAKEDFDAATYGEDWVFLGYITGGESAIAQLASNMRSVYPTDHFGTPLDDIPMMQDVNTWHEVSGVLSSDTGDWGGYFLTMWQEAYGVPMAQIGIAMLGSTGIPRWLAGNYFGMSVGSRGGAELEMLIGEPGDAITAMDSISVSHLLVVIAVILGNVGLLFEKGRRS